MQITPLFATKFGPAIYQSTRGFRKKTQQPGTCTNPEQLSSGLWLFWISFFELLLSDSEHPNQAPGCQWVFYNCMQLCNSMVQKSAQNQHTSLLITFDCWLLEVVVQKIAVAFSIHHVSLKEINENHSFLIQKKFAVTSPPDCITLNLGV